MEIRHLRYFVALAETRSFTRAAERVHVTQSTLSHQIRQLEDELGVALFRREVRGVALTLEGEKFLGYASQALTAVDGGILAVQPRVREARQTVRIGALPTLAASIVAQALALLVERKLPISITLFDMTVGEMRQALLAGEIELGLAYPPLETEGMTSEHLFTEQMVLVAGSSSPLAKRRRVPVAELHGRPLILPSRRYSIRGHLDDLLRRAQAEPVVVGEIDNIAATLNLLQHTDAIAILPESAVVGSAWRSILIERPFAQRDITLYRREAEALSPAADEVRRLLGEVARARKTARRGASA